MVTIFIDWFLPAYKAGGPIQTIANLVATPAEGLHYRVVCSNREWDGAPLDVRADRWLPFNPWTSVYYTSRGTGRVLWGGREEILYLNGMYSWNFVLKPVLFARARRKILAPRGMLHAGALSQKRWKKALYLGLWKRLGLHRKLAFHATDETEAAAIRNVFGEAVEIHLAANLPRVLAALPLIAKKRGELHLLTVALISPMKNILPVLQALQQVKERITYHIFGPVRDKAYWQSCRKVIAALPSHIHVTYHADLHPSRLEEALHLGQVVILPSRSENFGHALYEALVAGRPIITSHGTPWNGLLEARAGINLDPQKGEEICDAIRFFAGMDGEAINNWSAAARAYAEQKINRNKIINQYRQLFDAESSTTPERH